MTKFSGVLGFSSLQELFNKNFLQSQGGPFQVGNDTVDCGISPTIAWISNGPYASNGVTNPSSFGSPVDPSNVVLLPGQTLLAPASVSLNLIEGYYAFFSPRSGMARVGVEATAHVSGFSEMNWAKGFESKSRKIMVSVTSRLPVKGLTKVPLFQMRVFTGDTRLNREQMVDIMRSSHNLLIDPRSGAPLSKERQMSAIDSTGALVTTVHLEEGKIVGFKLKKNKSVLDLSKKGQDWKKFFVPIYAKMDADGKLYVDLYQEEYYLLITEEGLNLPHGYVASLEQLNARLISAVVHFAEYFGHSFKGAATLEVVPITHSIRVYNGSPIGAFRLEKIEDDAPVYKGFSINQNLLPQLPPTVTMPTL